MAGNTKPGEPIRLPLTRFARPEKPRRIFAWAPVAVRNRGNATRTPIRIPNARSEAPRPIAPLAGPDQESYSRPEQIARRLATWKAPALPDEILNALATIFLMHPGHELTPFFVWLDDRLRR
jgi:hypothetical protein